MASRLTHIVNTFVLVAFYGVIGAGAVAVGLVGLSRWPLDKAAAVAEPVVKGTADTVPGTARKPEDKMPVATDRDLPQPGHGKALPAPDASATTVSPVSVNKRPVQFASAVQPGEQMADGDLERSKRYFGFWELNCETAWSKNLRVCLIQQVLNDTEVPGASLDWRLATTVDNAPMMAIRFPATIDRSYGVRMGFMGFERKLDERQWYCGPQQCIAMIPYKAPFSDWIANVDTVTFGYSLDGKTAEFTAPMKGFMAALSFMAGQGKAQPVAAGSAPTRSVSNTKDQPR